jgi:prepilin-type N-terminal cleavage/methylation domain-containing protein
MVMTRHRAFTMIEVVVALVIILVLAAVALPNLTGYMDQQRVTAAAAQLQTVRGAVTAFEAAINMNAGRLSELSQVIVANNANYATGTDNSCGNQFKAGEVTDWEGAGPFTTYSSDRATGMMTPIGLAADSLTRIPNTNQAGQLRLTFINNVELSDAQLLDQVVDGTTNGNAAGDVQWTPACRSSKSSSCW